MQEKTTLLATTAADTGLNINRKKTELMKINTTAQAPITLDGEPIKEVESFTYLGSVVDQQGGTDEDIKSRIGKVRTAFIMLKTSGPQRKSVPPPKYGYSTPMSSPCYCMAQRPGE
ncbi:uncharacterized protein LOC132719984 [Ruditapes philippinarum]|uniref:uncharacterized protein LOC132719984 n=1 Tax=Ruditapes philippinarum TaxID=129788 RepID=UPI00295B1E26|nr:uncharacterized protein LOC132719984 [Ruditapes philippinarum]